MSIVLSLTALAVVAGSTLSTVSIMSLIGSKDEVQLDDGLQNLETMFVDCDLLAKTLAEHGCCVNVNSENEIIVQTSCGNLRYARNSATEAFGLYINEVNDPQALIENLRAFEFEYGKNVQAYTYDHILSNLSEDMTFQEEEILEDDSLLLTITID